MLFKSFIHLIRFNCILRIQLNKDYSNPTKFFTISNLSKIFYDIRRKLLCKGYNSIHNIKLCISLFVFHNTFPLNIVIWPAKCNCISVALTLVTVEVLGHK